MTLSLIEHANYYEISFSKSETRNSFGLEEATQLHAILERKEKKPILFFSKLERTFCSGGNLKVYAKKTKKESLKINKQIRKCLKKLYHYPELTIALVDGDCLGGGLEVLSSFNHIVASPGSLFALWQRRIGLSFGWGGGARLLKRMGDENLRYYSLSTKTIDAYSAKEMGLVDLILEKKEFQAYSEKLIHQHMNLPKGANSLLLNFREKKEVSLFEKIWGNPDHNKALKPYT